MKNQSYGVGNRLSEAPSPELEDFFQRVYLDGFSEDDFRDSMWINLVHVEMLVAQNIISEDDGYSIRGVLKDMAGGAVSPADFSPDIGDSLPNIERIVAARLGHETGGRLHTGRSRGDYYATLSRLKVRRWVLRVYSDLLVFRKLAIDLALEHSSSIMPGYTHLQHAQPITLGHYLMSVVNSVERDCSRLRSTYDRLNVSPLGLGIISGSSYPVDRSLTAERLGFSGLTKNSRDIGDRDYSLEFMSNLTTVMIHMHKLATDLYEWCTSEFAFVRVSDSDAMTSSMMPQKANPVLLEELRGRTGSCIGNLTSAFCVAKGSPANNIEITMIDAPVLASAADVSLAVNKFGSVISRISFDRDRMSELAGSFWSQATDVADFLVKSKGFAFRDAHDVVGTLVSKCIAVGKNAAHINVEDLVAAAQEVMGVTIDISSSELENVVSIDKIVGSRDLYGGPKSSRVEEAVAESNDELRIDSAWISAEDSRLDGLFASSLAE